MNKSVNFIHISDTHLGGSKDFLLHGINTYKAAEKAVQAIYNSQLQYDFIIHTGDVAAVNGTREEYKLASELFQSVSKPVYYVTGNHDRSSLMKEILKFGDKTDLTEDPDRLFYQFEIKGHRFLVLDAQAPKEMDPHGRMPKDQLNKLGHILKDSEKRVTIFIHYPARVPDSAWLKEKMTILNDEEILKTFNTYSSKINGVFSGHIHKGITIIKDQIVYSTVGSTCMQFRNNPDDQDVIFTSSNTGFFNYVTISENSLEIKEYSFINESGVFVKNRLEMTGVKQ